MKTKTFISCLSALALAGLVSCQKNQVTVTPGITENPEETGKISVTVSVPEPETKAPNASVKDAGISSVQLFIFDRATGLYEKSSTRKTFDGETTVTMSDITSRSGEKIVWAVLNNPAILAVANEAALKSTVLDLANSSPTALAMSGSADVDVTANATVTPNIVVERLVAKVNMEDVSVNFGGTGLQGATFTIKAIYLKNVVGNVNLDGSAPNSLVWYNQRNAAAVSASSAAIKALTLDGAPTGDNGALNITYTNISSTTGNYIFDIDRCWYVFPNAATQDDMVNYPTRTHLVIRAHLGGSDAAGTLGENGRDTYYEVALPGPIQRNYVYNITKVNITGEGKPNDDDDHLTEVGTIRATITVKGWEDTETISYNL